MARQRLERMTNFLVINKISEGLHPYYAERPNLFFLTIHEVANSDLERVYIGVFHTAGLSEVIGPISFAWANERIRLILEEHDLADALLTHNYSDLIIDSVIRFVSRSLVKVILHRKSLEDKEISYNFVFDHGEVIRFTSAKSESLKKLMSEIDP